MDTEYTVVYCVPNSDLEIPMVCRNVEEFAMFANMYIRHAIDIKSVNGIPVGRVSDVEVVEPAESSKVLPNRYWEPGCEDANEEVDYGIDNYGEEPLPF